MPSALDMLAGDALGELAEDTGKVGRLLAFWNICSARNLAWDFASHLRDLTGAARDTALALQDGITGALGRAILAQVLKARLTCLPEELVGFNRQETSVRLKKDNDQNEHE